MHPPVFLSGFHVSISSFLSRRLLLFRTASPPFHLLNTHFLITMPGPCQEAPREATKETEPEHLKALCPQRKKSSFGTRRLISSRTHVVIHLRGAFLRLDHS